jgi:hypothetical protein
MNCGNALQLPAVHNHAYPWLWAPAFAGATMEYCKLNTAGKSLRFAGIVSSPSIKNISLYRNSDLRYEFAQPAPP